ncbi:MAG: U32 family peptidase [Clostridia bacterium]|nr:U32 family peptidase [Clostridia bacterium]
MNKVELLAPAGDPECFDSALKFGADAIYLAGTEFGMRTASRNFSPEALKNAVDKAHAKGVRVHVTCNTLPRNDEMERLPEFLTTVQDCGADAFIIADLGVMSLAAKYAPKVERHVSTQAGVVNYQTARVLYEMGASRVVLARELSLNEIAALKAKIPSELEIETFVHGSMCVSFSGRCLISSYMTGRDANRGDCAQPCRWKYQLFEEHREGQYFPVEENENGTFLYNSRDLCMIEHIPELLNAGINSLKIEGRAKSAYYVSVITNAYRHAIDEYYENGGSRPLSPWIREELEKVSHREYNTGFFFGSEPGQVTGNGGYIRHYDVVAVCDEYKDHTAYLTQRNRFFSGDRLDVLPPSGEPFEITIDYMQNDKGEQIDVAPHAMQKVIMPSNVEIPAGSVLRKQRD